MSINFNRNRTQVSFESFVGISSPKDMKAKKMDFKEHYLTDDETRQLQIDLREDAIDFFYNGVLSFSEGIDSVFQKRFSWATVKLYYSIYYLLRASFATKDIAILRCMSMYRLKIASGEKPYTTGNKKYNTNHEGTIAHYIDMFSHSDRLLSNKIDDIDAYEWMMRAREIVNYKSSSFLEPGCLDIWQFFSDCVDDNSLVDELEKLENDEYVRCFQEEFAVLAIPIKRMKQTILEMANAGLLAQLAHDREEFVKSVIDYDHRSISVLSAIFSHSL